MKRPKNQKITTRLIAEATGFSHSTVSRTLANTGKVHSETAAKIIDAARKLGYRFGRLNEHRVIGLIIPPENLNGYNNSILLEVMRRLRLEGYRLELVPHDDIQLLSERSICGAVDISCVSEIVGRWFEEYNIPLVRINGMSSNGKNIYSVNSHGYTAMEIGVKYLLKKGAQKIFFLSEETRHKELELSSRRYPYFCRIMAEHGIADPEKLCYFDTHLPDLKKEMKNARLGLLVAGEIYWLQVLNKLQTKGIRINEDLLFLPMEYPGLSDKILPHQPTISQNFPLLAEQAVTLLANLLNESGPRGDLSVPYFLINRK